MSLTQEQIKNLLVQRKATGENEILYRVQLTGNHMPGMLEVVVDGIARFFGSTNDMYLPPKPTKYDPCRKFRKGDKAKPRIINGREIPKMPLDVIFTVTGDEDEYGAVPVEYLSPVRGLLTSTTVHAVWLELVTPVEELEPYYVVQTTSENAFEVCRIKNGKQVVRMCYFYEEGMHEGLESVCYAEMTESEAKAAAEAERDRLNAEYRKEQQK